MSIFDRFLDISPLTFQMATKVTPKTNINAKKHVLIEGELMIKVRENPASLKYFKVLDRKLVCSSVKFLKLKKISKRYF